MDFEPFWALGGWLIFPNCMAVPKTSSSPSISEIHAKFHPFVLFLAIFFIFLLLINLLSNPTNPSMASSSSAPIKRLLLEPQQASAASTANLHPKQTRNRHTSSSSSSFTKRPEFGAEAHEVPSGPNPISN